MVEGRLTYILNYILILSLSRILDQAQHIVFPLSYNIGDQRRLGLGKYYTILCVCEAFSFSYLKDLHLHIIIPSHDGAELNLSLCLCGCAY